jgi:hypothetical protein
MNNKTNLLKETLTDLQANNKTTNDVYWVGSRDGLFVINWESFELIAEKTDYYSGYGAQEIARDLVVVGLNWWLERHEYDGAESWRFKTMPKMAKEWDPFNNVLGNSLKEIGKRCCDNCDAYNNASCRFHVQAACPTYCCLEWEARW